MRLAKRTMAEGGETGKGGRACSATTPAVTPTAGRGWSGVRPPPRTPPRPAPPPLPQVRARPRRHHPRRARGWVVEKGSEMEERRETGKRGMAVAGTGAGGKGAVACGTALRPQSSRALPRNPGRHSVPFCSLGEGEAGSPALARPPPPSASDTWSGTVGGRRRKRWGENLQIASGGSGAAELLPPGTPGLSGSRDGRREC